MNSLHRWGQVCSLNPFARNAIAPTKKYVLPMGICIVGLLIWNVSAQEKVVTHRASEYLKLDRIIEMRMSAGPGDFDAPVRNSIRIDRDRAFRILELAGEAEAVEWPEDTQMWVESLVMIVESADNRLQRVSVFQKIQNKTPYLVVVGLRCFKLTNSNLLERIFEIAEMSREKIPGQR